MMCANKNILLLYMVCWGLTELKKWKMQNGDNCDPALKFTRILDWFISV